MSRKKCSQVKTFQEPGGKGVLDDSDFGYPLEKLCRQPANQPSRGRADQAVKTTDTRCANIRKTDNRVG